jgi:hypothetical protein
MAQPFRRHHSPEEWLRRLDRAAARINPLLIMLAIGLVILNVTCFVLMAHRFPVIRLAPDAEACLLSPASSIELAPAARVF